MSSRGAKRTAIGTAAASAPPRESKKARVAATTLLSSTGWACFTMLPFARN